MRIFDTQGSWEHREVTDMELLLPLSRATLYDMRQAAEELLACYAELAQQRRNLLQEAIGDTPFIQWEHYPADDVIERRRHYYYHAHAPEQRDGVEHGHFHVFVRLHRMRTRPQPWIMQGVTSPSRPALQQTDMVEPDPLVHLIAVSVDQQGVPCRLFTTNQWVTNETWCAASDVEQLLRFYRLGAGDESTILTRWLSALLRLYRPQIAMLLRQRDGTVKAWAKQHRGKIAAIHDERLEVCSHVDIVPDRQIQAIAELCSSI